MLSGSLEHTLEDAAVKTKHLKDVEALREAQAKAIDKLAQKQAGILKTQAWVKSAMRTEDDKMNANIKQLARVEKGYDKKLQTLWGQIKHLHKEEALEKEEKARAQAAAAAQKARLAAAWSKQRATQKALEAAELKKPTVHKQQAPDRKSTV